MTYYNLVRKSMYLQLIHAQFFSSNTSNCVQSTEITTSDQNAVKFDHSDQNVQFVFDTWKVGHVLTFCEK